MTADFAKEKVFWTRKMNLKLVKFMESKPNIWNPKHPKYTSVEQRDKTYAEFASKYGNEFTGQAVKDRWTNIRSTFANHLRKLKASQAKGEGKACKITWHLWDACRFLLKVNKNSLSSGATSRQIEINGDLPNDADGVPSESESEKSISDADATCQNVANGILNILRGVQNDVYNVDDTKYGQLGRLVTSKLSQMSSYDAAQMSYKILGILLMHTDNSPMNPNDIKLES